MSTRGRPRRSWKGRLRPTEYAADLAARAACQVGQFFEKQGDKELADGFIASAARRLPRAPRPVALREWRQRSG